MTSLRRLTTSLVPFFVLGACSQLIGLSDYEKGDGSAGEGGEETGGNSGTNSGGSSGVAPKTGGGEGGEDTGGTAGTITRGGRGGTSTGGTGGEPDGGDPGQGGSTGGRSGGSGGMPGGTGGMGGGATGGSAGTPAMGGSAGSGGSPACTEITLGALVGFTGQTGSGIYTFDFAPELDGAAQDLIDVQFWDGSGFDGASTGTFMLGTGPDANYATCSRCVLVSSDAGTTTSRSFFQTEGTIVVAPSSMQMTGGADFSLSDVTLREVTIDGSTFNSTLVPGGACLHIESASYNRPPPPPDWDCDLGWYYDSDCDCGCGAPDPACANGSVASCDYCWCDDDYECLTDEVNSTSNWICP